MLPVRMSVYAGGERVGLFGALQTPIMRQLEALARVPSNQVVGVTAQLDREEASAVRYVLDDPRAQTAADVGEVNTGDPLELVEFVRWSRGVRPAGSEIVVLSGHGLGFLSSLAGHAMDVRGILPNVTGTGEKDLLTTRELADALQRLSAARGAPCEVIVFDACLMSTVEVLTEVSPHVRAVVGTPDELSGGGYNLAGAAAAIASAGRALSPVELAGVIASSYAPQDPADMCIATCLTDRNRDAAAQAFGDFAQLVAERACGAAEREVFRRMFARAGAGLNRFRSNGLTDLAVLRYEAAAVSSQLASPLERAMNALNECVVHRVAGRAASGFLGISIGCPATRDQWLRDRGDYLILSFDRATRWSTMLGRVFGEG